jgi:hypothetical protein
VTHAVFSGGQFHAGSSGETFDIVNPANGALVERMTIAGASDVDAATGRGPRPPSVQRRSRDWPPGSRLGHRSMPSPRRRKPASPSD